MNRGEFLALMLSPLLKPLVDKLPKKTPVPTGGGMATTTSTGSLTSIMDDPCEVGKLLGRAMQRKLDQNIMNMMKAFEGEHVNCRSVHVPLKRIEIDPTGA